MTRFLTLGRVAAAAVLMSAGLAGAAAAAPGPQPAPRPTPAAATPAAPASPGKDARPSALGELGSSKAPINIDSDRLDVFDKEGRAVFSGNVVAVQGDSTMRCTTLNVFYDQNRASKGQGGTGGLAGGVGDNSSIKKIECHGPVTVASKTQVATSDNAEFDRIANKVYLTGNAALSDGPNVTRGDRIIYDLNTGRANVESKPAGRVRALFVPGSSDKDKAGEKQADKAGDKKKPAR